MQRKAVLVEEMMTSQKTCRVLFYGPADAGKRANLRHIHQSIPPEQRLTLASDDPERQIAFKVKHGEDGTWQVLVQAVDTGREPSRPTGMDETPPFDGVVFVVDSSLEQLDQSLASFEALKSYLDSFNLDLTEIPVVIQYNGREKAEVLPIDRMESLLNPWGLLSFPANAAKGEGVRETLKSILGLTVSHLHQNPRVEGRNSAFETPILGVEGAGPASAPATAPTRNDTSGLGIDYGPPIPGSEIGETTKALGDAIFEELNPPVVIPVKIPRRLLNGKGTVKILLEVEIDDSSNF